MNIELTLEQVLSAIKIADKEKNIEMKNKLRKLFNNFDTENLLVDECIITYLKEKDVVSFFAFNDIFAYLGKAFNERNKEVVKKINDLINLYKTSELDINEINEKINSDNLLKEFFNKKIDEVEIIKNNKKENKINESEINKQNIKGWTVAS